MKFLKRISSSRYFMPSAVIHIQNYNYNMNVPPTYLQCTTCPLLKVIKKKKTMSLPSEWEETGHVQSVKKNMVNCMYTGHDAWKKQLNVKKWKKSENRIMGNSYISYTEKWFYKLVINCTKEQHVAIGEHVSEGYFIYVKLFIISKKQDTKPPCVYMCYNFPISLCLKQLVI